MKDPRSVVRDLREVYRMRFRMDLTRYGEAEYSCTIGMLSFMKDSVKEAAETIEYLLNDRESLLEQLTEKEDPPGLTGPGRE